MNIRCKLIERERGRFSVLFVLWYIIICSLWLYRSSDLIPSYSISLNKHKYVKGQLCPSGSHGFKWGWLHIKPLPIRLICGIVTCYCWDGWHNVIKKYYLMSYWVGGNIEAAGIWRMDAWPQQYSYAISWTVHQTSCQETGMFSVLTAKFVDFQ